VSYAKTALLLGALTALVVVLAQLFGGTRWGIGALVVMGAFNFVTYYYSDRIVILMHHARPLDVREAPGVHASVERLARRAGIPVPTLYYVPDPAPNAFATGRNPEHAAVAVTQGLLEILDDREIEAVIGHELSHVLNRDILIATVAATMAGAVSLLARMAGWALLFGRGRSDDGGRGGNPVSALLLVIVAPVLALVLQLAVSRSREYAADAAGARLAGDPEVLASALQKLAAVAGRVPMRTADPATSHLYIVAPLMGTGAFLAKLLSTHPPVEERVRRLLAMRA
jgi:heat shock protein HtpX